MYKDHKRYNKNGYVIVNIPDHPKAFDATGDKKPESFCVYEHVVIAEEVIDRSIKEGEVVHHLDENRSNNSPDNLLVLSGPMHGKLHRWLNKHDVVAKGNHIDRIKLGCIRCANCEKPIPPDLNCCSIECHLIYQRTQVRASGNPDSDNNPSRSKIRPAKEILEKEVQELPMTKLGEKYGVSDNAVRKWCESYEIDLPDRRGFWTKKKLGLI